MGCGGHEAAPRPPAPHVATIALAGLPATIPDRYTCTGAGDRPPLRWGAVPRGTRELVLIVTDPDAPGGRFVHWTAYGMRGGARVVPVRVREGENSAGKNGWTPPCPPQGDKPHRYVFDLYALPRATGLKTGASGAEVTAAVRGALARGELVARFGRH